MFVKVLYNKLIGLFLKRFDSGTLELLKHGKNYISASVLVRGLSIISIPIMTRLLEPSDYGIISVFSSVAVILGILFSMGITGAVSRYYYEENNDFGQFLFSNIILFFSYGVILFGLIIYCRSYLGSFVNLPFKLIGYAAIVSFLTSLYDIVVSYFQASQQSVIVSRIAIIRTIITLFLSISITLALNYEKYLGPIYTQIIVSTLFLFYCFSILKKVCMRGFKAKHIRYSVAYGLPVIVHLLSSYVLNTFDQIMVNKYVGSSETGLYSYAYKVGMIFQLILVGLTQSWTPLFFKKMKQKEFSSIDVVVRKYSLIVAILAIILAIVAPIIFSWLAPTSYRSAMSLVPVIISGFVFQHFYVMYINYSFYEKKTMLIALITLLSGGVNIVLNYLTIPIYGYVAAAWTTLVSYALLFLMHYLNVLFIIKPEKVVCLKDVALPGFLAILVILGYSLVVY